MVDVLNENYWEFLPQIERSIIKSTFIAVDLEFLGIPSYHSNEFSNLFDDAHIRYQKIRNWVINYPPCQIGIACYVKKEDGFEADVFRFPLFKRKKHNLQATSSSLQFLNEYNFDFNKMISNGISYLNQSEIRQIHSEILATTIDYNDFSEGLSGIIESFKVSFLSYLKENTNNIMITKDSINNVNSSKEPFIYQIKELVPSCTKLLTELECSIITYELEQFFPDFAFHFFNKNTSIQVQIRNPELPEKDSLERLLFSMEGFSHIFKIVSNNKIALVGHNFFLDLMYIYNSFVDELPSDYDEWKNKTSYIFRDIYDTKILEGEIKKISNNYIVRKNLFDLDSFLETCPRELKKFPLPKITLNQFSEEKFVELTQRHDAATDAFLTGRVFLRLSHIYASIKYDCTLRPPFFKVLLMLYPDVCNRIYVPLIDYQHCFLAGEDPLGCRPDIISVRLKRQPIFENHWLQAIFGYLLDWFLGPTKFSIGDFRFLSVFLQKSLEEYRLQCALDSTGSNFLIATGSRKTYARVCTYFTNHEKYYLCNHWIKNKTFAHMMMNSRKQKDDSVNNSRLNTSIF